jgi:hypothetical protein
MRLWLTICGAMKMASAAMIKAVLAPILTIVSSTITAKFLTLESAIVRIWGIVFEFVFKSVLLGYFLLLELQKQPMCGYCCRQAKKQGGQHFLF